MPHTDIEDEFLRLNYHKISYWQVHTPFFMHEEEDIFMHEEEDILMVWSPKNYEKDPFVIAPDYVRSRGFFKTVEANCNPIEKCRWSDREKTEKTLCVFGMNTTI